jgi:hypothetical protein
LCAARTAAGPDEIRGSASLIISASSKLNDDEGGETDRAIAGSLGIARSALALILERVAPARLRWPLPPTLSDRLPEAMLSAGPGSPWIGLMGGSVLTRVQAGLG